MNELLLSMIFKPFEGEFPNSLMVGSKINIIGLHQINLKKKIKLVIIQVRLIVI